MCIAANILLLVAARKRVHAENKNENDSGVLACSFHQTKYHFGGFGMRVVKKTKELFCHQDFLQLEGAERRQWIGGTWMWWGRD